MANTNRETVRDELATTLSTALTGGGNAYQAVYGYLTGDFSGQSPVLVVASAGSDRPRMLARQKRASTTLLAHFFFDLHTFVTREYASGTWTEQDAEDQLDLCEKELADAIDGNQVGTNYTGLDYTGPSRIEPVVVGGEPYWMETVRVKVEAFG